MFKNKNLLVLALISVLMTISFTACSSSGGSASTSSSNNKSTQNKDKVFEMYNKVKLGMTKDQVDAVMTVKPTAETTQYAYKNTFNYEDMDSGYGVTVLYNDKNQAFSRTAIYGSHAVLAPFCAKPVTEEQADKIKKDMAYQDVIKVLGGEGIECSNTGNEKDCVSIGVIRRWANSDGSCMQIVFSKDDKAGNVLFFKQ